MNCRSEQNRLHATTLTRPSPIGPRLAQAAVDACCRACTPRVKNKKQTRGLSKKRIPTQSEKEKRPWD